MILESVVSVRGFLNMERARCRVGTPADVFVKVASSFGFFSL